MMITKPTRENFARIPCTPLDGAWGTELMRRGASLGECLPAWNLRRPADVESVAAAYVAAGSRCLLTNTFLADPVSLTAAGLGAQTEAINEAAVALARRAAGEERLVAGSLGPALSAARARGETGLSPGEAAEALARQARVLEWAGADFLILETQSDLAEATTALSAVLPSVTLPVGVSFSFHSGAACDRIRSGETVREVVAALAAYPVSFIGANCGGGIDSVRPLAREFLAAAEVPVWIRPNAMNSPEDTADTEPVTPGAFGALVNDLREAGVRMIGGCCGCGPEHIAAAFGGGPAGPDQSR